MSTFKLKSEKKKCLTHVQTLDRTHKNYETNFLSEQTSLPKKKKTLSHTKKLLQAIENKKKEDYTTYDVQQRSHLKSKVEALTKEIYEIENNVNELEYYAMTSDLLMEYYDTIEHYDTNDIDNNEYEEYDTSTNKNNDHQITENNDMADLDKLNQSKMSKKKYSSAKKKKLVITNNKNDDIMDYFNTKNKNNEEDKDLEINRKNLLDDFMSLVDTSYVSPYNNNSNIKLCPKCNIDRLFVKAEGCFACDKCGETEEIILENERTNNNEMIPEKSGYPYQRMNHLNEWIAQFQAKESTEVPIEIYDSIIAELKKNRIKDYSKLTLKKMKSILRKLRLHDYYEHMPHIISKINKLPPPTISREMEEEIRRMFRKMQKPFKLYKPKERTNFLNYSYVLHKICQLLELDHILRCFPLLKSRDKLRLQDATWAKICKACKWEFYPSV